MTRTSTHSEQRRQGESDARHAIGTTTADAVRRFGFVHLFAGLLGLVGPAVEGNDDGGPVNTEAGLFLGRIAVNGPHALFHAFWGLLGLRASRDEGSARAYAGLSAVVFAALAVVGWRRFGFERGVHRIGAFAVDGWGNFGHAVISAVNLCTVLRSRGRS